MHNICIHIRIHAQYLRTNLCMFNYIMTLPSLLAQYLYTLCKWYIFVSISYYVYIAVTVQHRKRMNFQSASD